MKRLLSAILVSSCLAIPAQAQTYISPSPTDVPSSGYGGLSKADRKKACTLAADNRHMTGLSRQQYRAACRGRPIPRRVKS
ncbi:hypothetical protein [Methylobacterium planeticum]|uniref:Phosphate starvation-inducible protein PsiF n=1 Tax=Methylobacterium planeticum TaxID=2615211 RepID=A0A6N6MMY3_9HYPH|nr:hypothetical protein [Methylobacterium planeticum]KAB1072751.1 hypothetical protein F6X51_14165 [Methylobacterium planeticum]